MRTIKFRAQCSATTEWVYGLPTTETTISNSISHISQFSGDERKFGRHNVKINPDTVGQFTGLHDKNRKEVYEGDVVRIVFNQNANSYNGSNVNLTEHICIVEYNAAMAGFCLRNTTDKTPNKHNFKVISFNHYRLRDVKEIIGNVHENPELLTTKK